MKVLLVGYLAFALINASGYALGPFFDLKPYSYQVLNAFLVFHIFGISYIGYTNQNLLLPPVQITKYSKSTLSKEKQQAYLDLFKEYFNKEKPYLDQELTIQKVATELNISSNHLSQVINHNLGYGFNDFSNAYRVDLAKELIIQPEMNKFTIEAIANEVGFKSKSSFNAAFKKKCGMTPSDFRKQALQ
ncbi:MAG: AraC family transcriptional regulator [Cyclobacteriaceae bacterium]